MVLFTAAALMAAFSGPRHIHLSLAPTSSEMRVAWSTFEATHFNGAYYTSSGNCSIDSCGELDVQWSVRMTLSDSKNATGSRTLFKVDLGNKNCRAKAPDQCGRTWVVHTASMSGLPPETHADLRMEPNASVLD